MCKRIAYTCNASRGWGQRGSQYSTIILVLETLILQAGALGYLLAPLGHLGEVYQKGWLGYTCLGVLLGTLGGLLGCSAYGGAYEPPGAVLGRLGSFWEPLLKKSKDLPG